MKYRTNSILAHVPQNRKGERILKHALYFKEALGMRIFLMDTIKTGSILLSNPKSRKNQIRHQGALNKFNDFVKKVQQKEISDNIILRINWGKVVNTLITESEHGGHEFVIIDKSEKNNAEGLTKSEVDRYISKSYCPVLTVNNESPITEVKKIVIPIDISQRTKKQLYWATFFAKKLKAKIQIVSALNFNIKETKSLAYKNAEKLKKMLQSRRVECDIKLLKIQKQPRHQVIMKYIEEENPELVIIRTHQEFTFSGKKIGKFVSEIIHGCKIPVFTVGGISQDYNADLI